MHHTFHRLLKRSWRRRDHASSVIARASQRPSICLLACAAVSVLAAATISAALQSAAAPHEPRPSPPAIARIAGINVGVDTLATLQKGIGRGGPMHGGKGLCWAWPAAECVIRATFPSAPDESELLKAVAIEYRPRALFKGDVVTPVIHGYVRDLGWIRAVVPGVSRSKVRELTRRLPKPEENQTEMIWRATIQPSRSAGPAEPLRERSVSRWAAVLQFHNDKLQSIRVAAQ